MQVLFWALWELGSSEIRQAFDVVQVGIIFRVERIKRLKSGLPWGGRGRKGIITTYLSGVFLV